MATPKRRFRPFRWFLVLLIALTIGGAVALRYESACPPAAPAAGSGTSVATLRSCYGGPEVLQVANVATPVADSGEVLVEVRAASVNPLDWHEMRGKPFIMRLSTGIGKPSTAAIGTDFAGIVRATGRGVTRFTVGDSVFGMGNGAFAQYLVVGESRTIARMPSNVSFEEAAAAGVAAVTALQALRDGAAVSKGTRVLVNGASGGVGTYAVQIAKSMGAHVTGVASARNAELVRSLGADAVIDYTTTDFTMGAERYDAIIDMVGNHPLSSLRRVLTGTGVVVPVGAPSDGDYLGPLAYFLKGEVASWFIPQRFDFFLSMGNARDMEAVATLLHNGTMRSVIDRRYPLEQVRDAVDYLEKGRARGKVVLTMGGGPAGS